MTVFNQAAVDARTATSSPRNVFALVEILLSGVLVLLLGVGMWLGVRDADRRSRDALAISLVRQAQAALETYRTRAGSYPAKAGDVSPDDAVFLERLRYQPDPEGCGPDLAPTCRGYTLHFSLEGPLGALKGGACLAGPAGLSCS